MNFKIYTDGGSLNNPGEAAIAYIIYKEDLLLEKFHQKIGIASNNVAEYTALINALERILSLKHDASDTFQVWVFSDSELMVKQLKGEYKIKKLELRSLAEKVKGLEEKLKIKIKYTHILREKNKLADSLVKKALFR